MSGIRCVLLTPAHVQSKEIHVYARRRVCVTGTPESHCYARVDLGDFPLEHGEAEAPDINDPIYALAWPSRCDACGVAFDPDDASRGSGAGQKWRRSDTGEVIRLRDAPVGAMWYADWMLTEGSNRWRGPDGRCLVVRTPGGDWMIDSEASNCTRKGDDTHRCWIRHGEAPNITVDKNGNTCAAGAGSIQCGSYHGFLTDGELRLSR